MSGRPLSFPVVPAAQPASAGARDRADLGRRIVEAARSAGVPLDADAALAGALAQIEGSAQIPAELYNAVAEVLTFVWRASRRP